MMVSTRFSADIDAEYFSSEWKAMKNTEEDEIEEDTEGKDNENKKKTFWQDRNGKQKDRWKIEKTPGKNLYTEGVRIWTQEDSTGKVPMMERRKKGEAREIRIENQ